MEQLKACPFCGGEAELEHMGWPHHAYCSVCGAKVTSVRYAEEGEEEAAQKWNRREPETIRSRLLVHNIGNVDIPDGVSMDDFNKVMNNVVEALVHTENGESWPYETGCGADYCEIGGDGE